MSELEKITTLFAACMIAVAFSGCLENEKENETENNQSESLLDENCMDFEGLERCWDIYAPRGLIQLIV